MCCAKTRYRYRSQRVQVAGVNDQPDIDLISVKKISKQNHWIKYLLIVIDIFSRFLIVRPLLNKKKSQTVLNAIKDVFKIRKFKKVRSDKGAEFTTKGFKKLWKQMVFT